MILTKFVSIKFLLWKTHPHLTQIEIVIHKSEKFIDLHLDCFLTFNKESSILYGGGGGRRYLCIEIVKLWKTVV